MVLDTMEVNPRTTFEIPPSGQISHSAGVRVVPNLVSVASYYLSYLGADAKFQNPSSTPCGSKET